MGGGTKLATSRFIARGIKTIKSNEKYTNANNAASPHLQANDLVNENP